ncbi:MAG: hypothetical protein GEU75_06330 [Dehalococcoidia bacterium]|nr:hypothetical protein [Dehalococcoidia bacterium]
MADGSRSPHLTTREWQVLALIYEGLTNEQIGERLGISRDGVKYHVSGILSKLQVTDRLDAARWYAQSGGRQQSFAAIPMVLTLTRLFRQPRSAIPLAAATLIGIVAIVLVTLESRSSTGPAVDDTGSIVALDVAPEQPAEERRTPPPAPMRAPRYVTVWNLPDAPSGSHASRDGTKAIEPALIKATLAGDAGAVRRLTAAGPGPAILYDVESESSAFCETPEDLCFWALPLLAVHGRDYWAVISSGLAVDDEGGPYAQYVSVYEKLPDGSWSDELVRRSLTEPYCGVGCSGELFGVAWTWQGTGVLSAAPGERIRNGITSMPVAASEGETRGWLFLQGLPWMATSGSVFYALQYDPSEVTLKIVASNLHRRWAGELRDLDGDDLPEVVINEGDAYAFGGASGIDEQFMRLLRWRDGDLVEVDLALPGGLPSGVAETVREALSFAEAGLWVDARISASSAAARVPKNEDVQWLARRIGLITSSRLDQTARAGERAEGRNQRYDHDVLIAILVMAGDYDGALAHLESLPVRETWLPGANLGPNGDPLRDPRAGGHILNYTTRALEIVSSRAEVHALRALGLVMSQKPDYAAAVDELEIAVELDPTSAFFAEVLGLLRDEANR